MKTTKKLGIYMDHASAQLIEFSDMSKEAQVILSNFTIKDKHETLQRSESEMQNKEQHSQRAYFKQLTVAIAECSDVLLFGPTEAKTELLHFLRQDHKYENINIEVIPKDKLTENQQLSFVREYFIKQATDALHKL